MRLVTICFVVITLLFHTAVYSSNIEEKNPVATLVPLSGTYFIPGDFATINDAAISLNANGISGAVVFNVAANLTETAPAGTSTTNTGGIIFGNITGTSATNTITFQKNGVGANPLVTAGANHFAGGIMDAVIKIIGTDYLTFNGIDVSENPLNTTTAIATNNMTEFGYGFFYANPAASANGAQNNTIQNCSITLNTGGTNYQNTFGIFSTTVSSATNGTGTSSVTAITGSNSGNKLYGNTITNANFGIAIIGSNTAISMDTVSDIGGNRSGTGKRAEALGKLLTVKHVMVPGIGRLAVIRRLTPDTSALAKSRAAREAKVFAKQRQGFGLGVERTVTGTGPANEAAVIPAIPTLGRFFLHRDHVMSTDLVTDEAGSEWQRITNMVHTARSFRTARWHVT